MDDFWKVQRPWNEKRLKAITDHYGIEFFDGIKVLDLGCGHGFFGDELAKLGAMVTYCDARREHLNQIVERNPNADVRLIDLEDGWPEGQWDFIVHFGVLYHIENVVENLRKACESTEYMVLETLVCDSKDPKLNLAFKEDKTNISQAFQGMGSRPSPALIERVLTESGMEFTMLTTDKYNDHIHKYAWAVKNAKAYGAGLRRMWFVKKGK
jgi:SAM-dependent methyltransferase